MGGLIRAMSNDPPEDRKLTYIPCGLALLDDNRGSIVHQHTDDLVPDDARIAPEQMVTFAGRHGIAGMVGIEVFEARHPCGFPDQR